MDTRAVTKVFLPVAITLTGTTEINRFEEIIFMRIGWHIGITAAWRPIWDMDSRPIGLYLHD